MDNEFQTKIAGIPCICRVTHYTPEIPAILTGPWEDADPGAGMEFDYEILDRKGYRAKWLEAKVTEADEERLAEEWEATLLEHKHYYNEKD